MSDFYNPPSLHRFLPLQRGDETWAEHMPLAYDLVSELRPELVVDPVVTDSAGAYFTLCQAMLEQEVDGLCYGFGRFSDHEALNRFNREHFSGFSYLLENTPDNARRHFADASIDLLHIDARSGTESAGRLLESWYPALRAGGVLLMHGINDSAADLWQRWSEGRQHFRFDAGAGMGIIRYRGDDHTERSAPLMHLLFNSDADQQQKLRELYRHAARHLELIAPRT